MNRIGRSGVGLKGLKNSSTNSPKKKVLLMNQIVSLMATSYHFLAYANNLIKNRAPKMMFTSFEFVVHIIFAISSVTNIKDGIQQSFHFPA